MVVEPPSPVDTAEPPALGWVLYLSGLGAYWALPQLFFPLALFLVVVVSASWVLFDAHKVQAQQRPIGSPTAWSILTLLLWVAVLPIYLLKRHRLFAPPPAPENRVRISGALRATLIMLAVAALLLAVLWWFALGRDQFGFSRGTSPPNDIPDATNLSEPHPEEHLTPEEQVLRAIERARVSPTDDPATGDLPGAPDPRAP